MKIQSLATGDRQAEKLSYIWGVAMTQGSSETQHCDATLGGSVGHGIKRQDSHPLSPTVQPDLPGDPVPPGVPSGLRLREAHSRPGPQSWGEGVGAG